MRKKSRFFLLFIILTLGAGIVAGGWYYLTFHYPNITTEDGKTAYLLVPRGTTYEQLIDSLRSGGHLTMEQTFRCAAKHENLPENVHAGRYALTHGMNNRQLARQRALR